MLLLRRLLPHCVRRQTAHTRPLVGSQTANKQFRSSDWVSIITIRQFAALWVLPPWDSSCPLVAVRAPPGKPVFPVTSHRPEWCNLAREEWLSWVTLGATSVPATVWLWGWPRWCDEGSLYCLRNLLSLYLKRETTGQHFQLHCCGNPV